MIDYDHHIPQVKVYNAGEDYVSVPFVIKLCLIGRLFNCKMTKHLEKCGIILEILNTY